MRPATQCRIIAALPAAVLLLSSMLASLASYAAALGDELILSQLGDPVEVEIAVMQWEDIDLDQLRITAGTPEVYESFGLDYLPAIESLNFNLIGPNLDGEVKVLVSSREPMQEPYLELLLVMRWPGGSLLREYVLLFDPPRTAPVAPPVSAPVTPPPVSSTTPAVVPQPQVVAQPEAAPDIATNQAPPVEVESQQPEDTVEEPAAQPAPTLVQETVTVREIDEPVPASDINGAVAVVEIEEPIPAPNAAPAPAREGGTYTVESGDNLWGIASRFGPPNADIYQILLGIYELNRGSFINGNISLLKYGVTLWLPTSEDIAGIDPATAKSLFDQRWEEGSERIEMAQRGETLPPFSSIFAPEVVRPEFNPTAPFPENQGELSPEAIVGGGQGFASPGSLAPATAGIPASGQAPVAGSSGTAGQPSVPVVAIAPAVNSAGAPVPQAGTQGTNANATGSANPYLDGINSSMLSMQQILEAKQQQVELLEAQMSEMSARMLEITRVTERLNDSLDEALAQRARQQEIDRRNIFLLGGLVVVLSLAVIAIIMMVLKLAAQIRLQHELLQSSMQNRALAAAKANAPETKREPSKPLPDDAKTRAGQKYMASAQALSVSIIEDEKELPGSNPSSVADVNAGSNLSKEQMNIQLGDMELDRPEEAQHPESR